MFSTAGDSFAVAFSTAAQAADAAMEIQRGLAVEVAQGEGLRVRAAIHVGTALERGGDYFGPAVNRTARLMASAHGGQIVVSNVAHALLRDYAFVDLGEHQLKDLSDPERVWGLMFDSGEIFPALRTAAPGKHNLPSVRSSFIGRSEELARVRSLMGTSGAVTIVGAGGVGETRLALEVAASVPWAVDGVWLVELGPVRDAEEVPAAVAAAIGIRPVLGLGLAELIAQWCSSNRGLVVLDNCEHVLGGAAALVEAVLRRPTTTVLLATSREALSVAGEQVVALGSLPLPRQPGEATDAVRLFVSRAQDEVPGFDADSDPAAVAEICVRLDGIPLAIELAAARMRALTPRQVADRLDERFRLLTGGRRTAVERHKTLRATVEWSYDLLDAPHKNVFDQLSVFAAPFGLDDAVGLCARAGLDQWAVIDLLAGLVFRSLVTRTPEHRYRMLETLRSYGSERLDVTGTADAVRRAHAEWFRSKAAAARGRTIGPDELAELRAFIVQLPDYDAAIAWAFDRGDPELGIDIVFFAFESLYISQMRPMQAIGSFVEWMSATPWNAPDLGYDPPLPRRSLVRALIVAAGWFSAIEVNSAETRRLARQVIDIDPEESWGYNLQAMASLRSEPPADVFEWACAGVSAARNDITRLTWARYAQAWAAVRKGPADAARAVATGFQDWATATRSNIAVATAATVMVLLEWSENPVLALSHADAGLRAARATMARSPEHLLDAMRIKLLIELSLPDAQDAAHEVLDNYRRSGDHQLLLFQLALTTVVLQRLAERRGYRACRRTGRPPTRSPAPRTRVRGALRRLCRGPPNRAWCLLRTALPGGCEYGRHRTPRVRHRRPSPLWLK